MTEKPHITVRDGRWWVYPYRRGTSHVSYSYKTPQHAFTTAKYFWDFRHRWKIEKAGRKA